jgi:hypothetical protein
MQLLAMATTNINRRRIHIKLKDKRRRGKQFMVKLNRDQQKPRQQKCNDQRIEYAILQKEKQLCRRSV